VSPDDIKLAIELASIALGTGTIVGVMRTQVASLAHALDSHRQESKARDEERAKELRELGAGIHALRESDVAAAKDLVHAAARADALTARFEAHVHADVTMHQRVDSALAALADSSKTERHALRNELHAEIVALGSRIDAMVAGGAPRARPRR